MKRKYLPALFTLCFATAMIMTGCGSLSDALDYDLKEEDCTELGSYDSEMIESTDSAAFVEMSSYSTSSIVNETDRQEAVENSEQKIIVTWNLSMDTENYEDTCREIFDLAANAGGYIESQNEYSYYSGSRYCSYTIRIPNDQLDLWIDAINDLGTITTRSKSAEDVSLTYVDIESRITALETEQETLMNLLSQADSIETTLAIQSQLTDVNYQIESYESQLRVLSNQVDYSTVYLDLNEVVREVPVQTTMGSEIRETFLRSIEGVGAFFRSIIVGFLGNSVIIGLTAGLIAVIVIVIRKIIRHIRRKHTSD